MRGGGVETEREGEARVSWRGGADPEPTTSIAHEDDPVPSEPAGREIWCDAANAPSRTRRTPPKPARWARDRAGRRRREGEKEAGGGSALRSGNGERPHPRRGGGGGGGSIWAGGPYYL